MRIGAVRLHLRVALDNAQFVSGPVRSESLSPTLPLQQTIRGSLPKLHEDRAYMPDAVPAFSANLRNSYSAQ